MNSTPPFKKHTFLELIFNKINLSELLIKELAQQGNYIYTRSMHGAAEEAPDSYKDIHQVVEATEFSSLARRVAFLRHLACIKG